MCEYLKQATDFLKNAGATIEIEYLKHDYHFNGDSDKRDIYAVTIAKRRHKYTFNFGNSLSNSGFWNGGRFVEATKAVYDAYFNGKLSKRAVSERLISFNYMLTKFPTKPNAYDVLACLTTYNPGAFIDFCAIYGYSTDSIRGKETYYAVLQEYLALGSIFTKDELNQLAEIQ